MATNEQIIWDYFKSQGLNDYGVAGLMGNLYAESGLNPKNLQNTYEQSLGMSDSEYTEAVDNGSYTNFIHDAAGYGLAQWTYWSLKRDMLNYFQQKKKSIGDLQTQIEFLAWQLSTQYKTVWATLKNATSILQASNIVLLKFECPADQSIRMQNKRAEFSQIFYNKYSEGRTGINMGINKYNKNKSTQLSTNFTSKEFNCHGQGCCSETLIDSKLVEYVQQIRDHFNKPVQISSGYRCSTHNRNIGGATNSYHTRGQAADIYIQGIAPSEIAKYAESIGVLGIGLYETSSDGFFVHIDTRTNKSFWYGQREEYRSTFGGGSSSSDPKPKNAILTVGSTGAEVKQLQNNLNAMGYKCGTADGIYGARTQNEVRKFQNNNNLTPDGITGEKTQNAINNKIKNSYMIEVTASLLNVRSGPDTSYKIVTQLRKGVRYLVSEEKNNWGKIDGIGWMSLTYVKRV